MIQQTTSQQVKREPLKWLFVAFFADGSSIIQDQEDKCLTRTDGTGSTFTDVLAKESQLSHFELQHVDGKQAITVDLRTGTFIVNGTPLQVHDQNFDAIAHELRLVYFRESRVDQQQKATVQTDMSIKYEDVGKPRHYVNRYFIGWQTTTVHGKNIQHTIAVG